MFIRLWCIKTNNLWLDTTLILIDYFKVQKYVYVFAYSSDMYWDVDKTIKNPIEDNGRIFVSGFLL